MSLHGEKTPKTRPGKQVRPQGGRTHGPMGMGGPVEKAKDFKGTMRRLLSYLKPFRVGLTVVLLSAILSVVFSITGPKIMGRGTNILFDGVMSRVVSRQVEEAFGGTVPAWLDKDTLLLMLDALGSEELAAMTAAGEVDPAAVSAAILARGDERLAPIAASIAQMPAADVRTLLLSFSSGDAARISDMLSGMDIVIGGGVDYARIGRILGLLVGIYLLSAFFGWFQIWVMAGITQKTVYALRKHVDEKLDRLPIRTFDSMPRGDLLSRVTNDIDNIQQTLSQSITQVMTALLTVVGVMAMMLSISPLLALVSLVTLPLAGVVAMQIAKRSQKQFAIQWESTGDLNGHIEEMFTGHAIVQAYGKQEEAVQRFDAHNARLFSSSFKAQFISGVVMPVMHFFNNLNYVVICVVGGIRIAQGTISFGDLQAFIQYARQFTQPIAQTAGIFNMIQSTAASAERVFELLDEKEETPDAGMVPEGPVAGDVRFEQVSFRYEPDIPLIEDMNLAVEPGRSVAIVGPTGAGKTTLVNLLMRFYEIQEGTIRVDGTDIREMPREALRQPIGMVLQDTWLFKGTIRDNIAYGRENATEEDIREAARAAYVDHFVRTLPDGYDTILEDEGSNLSQGQRQLLTIARAFLAQPRILILDEATSSVDTRTEAIVQRAMARLMEGRTSFVIAHRLSTIQNADTILVMDHGRVVEQGRHQELLDRGGFYSRLYQSQFTRAQDEEVAPPTPA